MTLGIADINSCVTSKLPIITNKLSCYIGISSRQFTINSSLNKHQCNLFTMYSFYNNFFTVTANNNTTYSKNRIGNRNFHSKLAIIVFQINSISLIESEYFRETSIVYEYLTKDIRFKNDTSGYLQSVACQEERLNYTPFLVGPPTPLF